jgi:hypothetical protein
VLVGKIANVIFGIESAPARNRRDGAVEMAIALWARRARFHFTDGMTMRTGGKA